MTSKRHLGKKNLKIELVIKGVKGEGGGGEEPAVWDFPETGSNFG